MISYFFLISTFIDIHKYMIQKKYAEKFEFEANSLTDSKNFQYCNFSRKTKIYKLIAQS